MYCEVMTLGVVDNRDSYSARPLMPLVRRNGVILVNTHLRGHAVLHVRWQEFNHHLQLWFHRVEILWRRIEIMATAYIMIAYDFGQEERILEELKGIDRVKGGSRYGGALWYCWRSAIKNNWRNKHNSFWKDSKDRLSKVYINSACTVLRLKMKSDSYRSYF